MDPEANYREQLELAREIIRQADHETEINEIDAIRLAELVLALNECRLRGVYVVQPPEPHRADVPFVEDDDHPF